MRSSPLLVVAVAATHSHAASLPRFANDTVPANTTSSANNTAPATSTAWAGYTTIPYIPEPSLIQPQPPFGTRTKFSYLDKCDKKDRRPKDPQRDDPLWLHFCDMKFGKKGKCLFDCYIRQPNNPPPPFSWHNLTREEFCLDPTKEIQNYMQVTGKSCVKKHCGDGFGNWATPLYHGVQWWERTCEGIAEKWGDGDGSPKDDEDVAM